MKANRTKIKVLVVEDSAVAREWLGFLLNADPAIHVIGYARDGLAALAALGSLKPDLITMDLHLPGMNGYEASRRIMESTPIPIVIVSANSQVEEMVLRLRESGAVAAVAKPSGPGSPVHEASVQKFIRLVKAMAEVRVIKRRASSRPRAIGVDVVAAPARRARWIALGASTGGPPVLKTILAALPKPFPASVLVVQHISAGFVQSLADWLSQQCGLSVRVARDGDQAVAGRVYLAPDGCQMSLTAAGRICCRGARLEKGLCPSVGPLFRSVALADAPRSVGVLLSGMGRDGAAELKLMRERGAVTIVQDKASAVIHGMPGAALELGAAMYVLSPERIASALISLVTASEPTLTS